MLVNEIEKNQIKLEQTFKTEIYRLYVEIKRLDQRIDHLDQRIDTLNSTIWSLFAFLGLFVIAMITLITTLHIKISGYIAEPTNKEQKKKENRLTQKKIKELEIKLQKVMKYVPKAAL